MFLSDNAIRRPILTIVVMLGLVIFGGFALLTLNTDEYPDVTAPVVTVGLPYPGASPETVERELLDPVEEAIGSISGVKRIIGKAQDGFATVVIEFLFAKPLAEATQDIRDAISEIRIDLPVEMEEPIIRKFSETDLPVVSLALSSTTLSPRALTQIADPGITRELRSVPGVAEVIVTGQRERELTVELQPEALQALRVSIGEVVQALRLQNLAAPVGRLEGALDERAIRLSGRLEGPADFERIVVSERNGRVIRLGDLARVKDGEEEVRSLALFDDDEAVGIDIKKSKGYSTTEVTDRVFERLERVRSNLPAGAQLNVVKNSGTRVEDSVHGVKMTLLEGAFLTVLVVFLFLNSWRSTIITGLALPVSVLASFIAVAAFGFTLNTMSLLGLSLAIGILIDDAIVVRENIVRHIEMGKDHFTAAHDGTNEIGLAVTATTVSILAVFIPVAFLPEVAGQWFKPFGLTIACSVFVSLIVSFSLDPMLSAYWADPKVPPAERAWITRLLDRFNERFNKLAEKYRLLIAWALDHRAAVTAIAIATFVFALAMPAMRLVGVEFFPLDDQSEVNINLTTPPGSNLAFTRRRAEATIAILAGYPEVLYTYSTVGGGQAGAVDEASIYVKLLPKTEREASSQAVANRLRRDVGTIAGAKFAVFTNAWGGGRKQLQLDVRGGDAGQLADVADIVMAELAQVPDVVDLDISTKGQKPEVTVDIDRRLAGALGVSIGEVAQALRPAFAGIEAGDWIDPTGETREVRVRLTPSARESVADLRRLPLVLNSATGPITLPLGQVATVTSDIGPAIIDHLGREPVVTVAWNVANRSTGEVMDDVLQRLEGMTLPQGVSITVGAEAEQQNEVFGDIFRALGLAGLLMYLILAMQFGSFLDPLAIMLSLPLSLIGVMLALAVTGNTVNIMSLIGVILLMGIVAKNAILLIDFAKWAREREGLAIREALIEAGAIRLRPILMTTAALVAGMLPLALGRGEGAGSRSPLGIAVIGGVITSTLLTLVAIPTFYETLDGWRSALGRFFTRAPRPAHDHPTTSTATSARQTELPSPHVETT